MKSIIFIIIFLLTLIGSFLFWDYFNYKCKDWWHSGNIWIEWACSHHWWVISNLNEDWKIFYFFMLWIFVIWFLLSYINLANDEIKDKDMSLNMKSSFDLKIDLIKNAINTNKKIKFDYIKFNLEKSIRIVKPYRIYKYKWKTICVEWLCFTRNKKRSFAIGWISCLEIVDNND